MPFSTIPVAPMMIGITSTFLFHILWHSRSEGGPFSLATREELTLVLGFWELYILYPSQ